MAWPPASRGLSRGETEDERSDVTELWPVLHTPPEFQGSVPGSPPANLPQTSPEGQLDSLPANFLRNFPGCLPGKHVCVAVLEAFGVRHGTAPTAFCRHNTVASVPGSVAKSAGSPARMHWYPGWYPGWHPGWHHKLTTPSCKESSRSAGADCAFLRVLQPACWTFVTACEALQRTNQHDTMRGLDLVTHSKVEVGVSLQHLFITPS